MILRSLTISMVRGWSPDDDLEVPEYIDGEGFVRDNSEHRWICIIY